MELLSDPVFLQRFERIIVDVGALWFGYLGYRLYIFGVDKGQSKFATEGKLFKVIFSGMGPGLIFMAFSCVVLITSLMTTSIEEERTVVTEVPRKVKDNVVTNRQTDPESNNLDVKSKGNSNIVEKNINETTRPIDHDMKNHSSGETEKESVDNYNSEEIEERVIEKTTTKRKVFGGW